MPPRVMPSRMALDHHQKGKHAQQQATPTHAITDVDAHDKAERALEVVRELHRRYRAQDERWHNYLKLIGFIVFAGLLLSVIYLQRDAHVLYQVHSTIAAGVLPDPTTISSPQDVLNWLKGFLQKTWVDPACGDGLCESPFEFASYGRFGCRADCGRLSESVENLTTLQIDLSYNFNHPAGSIASTELMGQAQWNLCPEKGAPHGRDCYYEEDRSFDRIEGSVQEIIDDVPDGEWTIKIKRDFFAKVSGAVRVRDRVEQQARQYSKIYVAMESAQANHDYESNLLQEVNTLARQPLVELINKTMVAESDAILLDLAAKLQTGTIDQTQHDAAEAQVVAYRAGMDTNLRRRGNCDGLASYNYAGYPSAADPSKIPADTVYDVSIGGSDPLSDVSLDPAAAGTTLTYNSILPGSVTACEGAPNTPSDPACVCDKLVAVAEAAYTSRFETMQTRLISRLDRTNGRLGAQKTRKLALLRNIVDIRAELFEFIVDLSKGLEPLSDPGRALLDDVIAVYVDGPMAFGVNGQPNAADSALKRTTILELNQTTNANARGELLRLQEISDISGQVAQLPAVARVNAHLAASGGDIQAIDYTLVEWDGGSDAYQYCNLDARASAYEGACTPAMPYTLTGDDTAPYACTLFPNGTALAGADCQAQIDEQLDCKATCECTTGEMDRGNIARGCSTDSYCTCAACERLGNARLDAEFQSVTDIYTVSASGRKLSQLVADQSDARDTHRRRLQNVDSDTVERLLTSVNALRESQTGLKTQVSTLGTQVQEANQAAEERANDKTLENLIAAGRQDILLGQARVESLLAQIIGKQNQALAAAEQAEATDTAISFLAEKRTEAAASVSYSNDEQLSAIKQAAQQGLITQPQALVLWKRARRDRESALKTAVLANTACSTERVENHDFEVDNYADVPLDTARERLIGLTNRVIGGMLIHTSRMSYDTCEDSRFAKIENNCAGGISTQAYGVDPVFVMGSSLFDPDLDNERSLQAYYNCSDIPEEDRVYNVPDPYSKSGAVVNKEPYCANLYNMRDVPFGFFSTELKEKTSGFPVWVDINLSEDQAQYWYTYLEEGLMLDTLTREMTVDLVTYNAELRMFSSVFVRFRFTDGGAIDVTYKLHTIRVELYKSFKDYVRLVLELVFAACVLATAAYQVKGIHKAWAETRRPFAYFSSGWTWVGLSSTALMITSNIVWWTFVLRDVPAFDIDIRYNVYADLNAQARILRLNGDGSELSSAFSAFADLQNLVQTLSWYYALNGINILLVIARILNLMHFQPRLGVVTRSLLLAGPDLLHFAVVAGIVFVGYAMMAHVIFGNVIEKFSTFRVAVDTCFEMLLGEIGVNEDLKALTGLQGFAGSLFFWTFELLVFMVLLNFLLAIIVDAFSVVKDNTSESTGLHEEIGQMMREKWRAMLGRMLNVHYIPSSRLSALLKHWAGNDSDGPKTAVAEVEDQSKRIKVLDHELEEHALKEVLSEAMQNMLATAPELSPDERAGGGCMGRKGKSRSANLSTQELDSATKWLLERFGHEGGDDKEDSDADDDEGAKYSEEALEKERDALAKALERLAAVQKELAMGQHELMSGQKALADQQDKLVQFLESPFEEGDAALQDDRVDPTDFTS